MCLQQSQTTIPCGGNLEKVAPKIDINNEAHAACAQKTCSDDDIDPNYPDGTARGWASILS